jgi:hypothetical protein
MSPASPDPDPEAIPTLLIFALVPRGIDPVERAADEIERYRNRVLPLLQSAQPVEISHLSVLQNGNTLTSEALSTSEAWSGGSVDLLAFRTIDDLLVAYETALRAQRHRAPSPAWSSHVYATLAYSVRQLDPEAPIRKFTIGRALSDVGRAEWLGRWHEHGSLIVGAPTFESYLKGYVQYHFLDNSLTGEVGIPDGHSAAQTGWTTVKDMDYAYSLPDYLDILRRDESNLIVKDQTVRMLATPGP